MPIDPVIIETSLGNAEAVSTGAGEWHIGYPWGDQRFYGTRSEVQREMRQTIAVHDEEDA